MVFLAVSVGLAAVTCLPAAGAYAGRMQVSEPMFLGQLAWSPDGKHIAWVAGPPNGYGTVWVADASGQNARPLHQFGQSLLNVDGVGQLTWKSSSSLLVDAYLNDQSALYRVTLSGQITVLAQLPDQAFSTDRRQRLVATEGYSACENCSDPIDVLHLASGKVTGAGSPGDYNASPALSPNGRRLAYERGICRPKGCGNSRGIWLGPASRAGNGRELVPGGQFPLWSPDGRTIAYMVNTPKGFQDLGIVRPGKKPHTLPRAGAPGAFSPDSRLLAYDGETNSGSWGNTIGHLVLLNLHRRRATLVSPRWLGNINGQAWSPDGKKLIVVARPTSANPDCPSLYMLTLRTRDWKLFRACG
jgi:WD40 repeat protein